ncbi:hypothetical protein [Evansella clarkii]|uniref:hypothetical protein n=1 Tax=Evansella clarkii TaxID=79879 RepID=UPI000B44D3DB|nr:hypothetical protein [Evansella clarkii]
MIRREIGVTKRQNRRTREIKSKLCKVLSEDLTEFRDNKVKHFIDEISENSALPVQVILYSSWQSILKSISAEELTYEEGKKVLQWLLKRELS